MPWTLNEAPAPRDPGSGFLLVDGVQYPDDWPRADLEALGLVWVDPTPGAPAPRKVTRARFGDLFSYEEHGRMNLIRWQCGQMDAVDRGLEGNPLVLVETLFRKFDLPAEFIELDLPMVADGLALLGMLGVFQDSAPERIAAILADNEPA